MFRKPKSVEDYFEHIEFGRDIADKLRALFLQYDFTESIKWNFPVYSMDKKNLLSIGATKNYVGIWFFQGGLLKDELNLLINAQKGKTKAMRQMRFTKISEVSDEVIVAYIDETIENHKAGREIKASRANTKVVEVPPFLEEALNKNALLDAAFNELSQSKRNEYSEHIATAKQEATKMRRLDKILPMILEGKGLNDKYKKANC